MRLSDVENLIYRKLPQDLGKSSYVVRMWVCRYDIIELFGPGPLERVDYRPDILRFPRIDQKEPTVRGFYEGAVSLSDVDQDNLKQAAFSALAAPALNP